MKEFVYLYPIPEYINHEISNNGWCFKGGEEAFREEYKRTLNQAIDLRYRQQGFGVSYVIFDGHAVSDLVDVKPEDKVIEAGISFQEHTTKQPDGEYPYPDPNIVLNQLPKIKTVRVAGFHMWDCVQRLAEQAFNAGLEVLVDEELTEFLAGHIILGHIKPDRFPSYDPRADFGGRLEHFMEPRRGVPWLYQDY